MARNSLVPNSVISLTNGDSNTGPHPLAGYPQSNGLAEKGVGIAKKLLRKAKDSNTSPYLAFLEYRNTPLECGYFPSQLLISRRTKSILPITRKALKPQLVNDKNIQRKMKVSKQNQNLNHDRSARNLTSLNVGQSVRVRFGKNLEERKSCAKSR